MILSEKSATFRDHTLSGANLLHLGNEMPKQILDAVAERRRRAWAAGASAAHMQKDNAVAEALEGDIAAILRNGGTHASLEQLFDGGDDLGVLGREELLTGPGILARWRIADRLPGNVVLHDGAEHGRLQMLPLAVALG